MTYIYLKEQKITLNDTGLWKTQPIQASQLLRTAQSSGD